MLIKALLFCIFGCFLNFAVTGTYTVVRIGVQWVSIHVSTFVHSIAAGLASFLVATAILFASIAIRRVLGFKVLMFKEKGLQFVITTLLFFPLLAAPGYWILKYMLHVFIATVAKQNINQLDIMFLPIVVLYAFYVTYLIFFEIESPHSRTNAEDNAPAK